MRTLLTLSDPLMRQASESTERGGGGGGSLHSSTVSGFGAAQPLRRYASFTSSHVLQQLQHIRINVKHTTRQSCMIIQPFLLHIDTLIDQTISSLSIRF